MSAPDGDAQARVTFIRETVDADGRPVVLRREVACDHDRLAELLSAPWEEPSGPGAARRVRDLAASLGEQIARTMRFSVEEQRTARGRRFVLTLAPSGEAAQALDTAEVGPGDDPARIALGGRVDLRGDDGEGPGQRSARSDDGRQIVVAQNTALQVGDTTCVAIQVGIEVNIHL